MLIFEPHNLFGTKDPEGEPWPFGYISEADTPNRVSSPIFELSPVLGTPELWAKTAAKLASVDDLLAALKEISEEAGYGVQWRMRAIARKAIAKAQSDATPHD